MGPADASHRPDHAADGGLNVRFRRSEDPKGEIEDYLQRETRLNVEEGMSPEEARLAARRKLGPVARVMEESREASLGLVWRWLDLIWRDLRHGARMFAKNPGFTLTAIVSLAFGTGANVAMFSITDAILLRPLAVPHPREIMSLGTEYHNDYSSVLRTSYPDYLEIRNQARSFDGLFAYTFTGAGFAAQHGATAQVKAGAIVTGNLFQALGVEPRLGRPFRPDEDQVPGRDAVVVLSYGLWQDLGGDPKIIDRSVEIAGIDFTVIGVAPEDFDSPDHFFRPAFYVPVMMWPRISGQPKVLEDRLSTSMRVKGRLKSDVLLSQAEAELETIASNLNRAHPETNQSRSLIARTEFETAVVGNRVYSSLTAILTLLAAAVLIVACANVAGLLTSRAPLRAREMALRLAVGAGRGRLIRQLLTESSMIALAGGVLGLPLAYLGVDLFRQIRLPTDLVMLPKFDLDARALAFALIVAMSSVILFGLIPAIQTARTNLTSAFKAGGGVELGRRRLWGRNLLVALQVAVSLVLLTVAVFTRNAFQGELTRGMGFRSDHLAMVSVDPNMLRYSEAQSAQFFQTLTKRAEALPGVQSAALTSGMLGQNLGNAGVEPEGYRLPPGKAFLTIFYDRVDEHYFDTFEIPIERGRGFTASDTKDTPAVAVVNQTFAAHYWPNQDPLGKRFLLNGVRWVEVVGIARNSHYLYMAEPTTDFLYLPYRQTPPGNLTLLAATSGDSASLLEPLRKLVRDMDPAMPMYDVMTMEQFYSAKVTGFGEVMTTTVGAMGLMGVILSMVGLYALMSYSVSRRTREIGIRMAVGADRAGVTRMVVRQGLAPVVTGLGMGLLLSAAAGQWLRAAFPLRYEIGPAIYGVMAPLLLAVAMLAAFAPARRASLVDPMVALREE